jgi:hypothetical protein
MTPIDLQKERNFSGTQASTTNKERIGVVAEIYIGGIHFPGRSSGAALRSNGSRCSRRDVHLKDKEIREEEDGRNAGSTMRSRSVWPGVSRGVLRSSLLLTHVQS